MQYNIDDYTYNFKKKLLALIADKYRNHDERKRRTLFKKEYCETYNLDEKKFSNTSNEWLTGRNLANFDNLLRLCSFFDCDIDYFITKQEVFSKSVSSASETTGLDYRAIEKISKYEAGYKKLLNNLIDCNDFDQEYDFLNMLLAAMLNYGMSTGTTSIILKDSLFNNEEKIADKELVRNMLKYAAVQIFDTCLDYSSVALRDEKEHIQELNSKLLHAKAELLMKQITDATGKTEEEIINEIDKNRRETT